MGNDLTETSGWISENKWSTRTVNTVKKKWGCTSLICIFQLFKVTNVTQVILKFSDPWRRGKLFINMNLLLVGSCGLRSELATFQK